MADSSDAAAQAATPAPSYSTDPTLYLYTSLTAGSSHIVTATSRMETILKANRIPFKGLDLATDEKARMLWGRRSGKDAGGRPRKLPGLVQEGMVIGDLVEVEDWNEYGELEQHVKIVGTANLVAPALGYQKPGGSTAPKAPATTQATKQSCAGAPVKKEDQKPNETQNAAAGITSAMSGLAMEAAQKAKDLKKQAAQALVGSGTKAEEPKIEIKEEKKEAAAPTTPQKAVVKPIATDSAEATQHEHSKQASIQSPTSTAWKPTDVEPLVRKHRGSEVQELSPEEIKKIEEEQAIKEVEEESDDEDEAVVEKGGVALEKSEKPVAI